MQRWKRSPSERQRQLLSDIQYAADSLDLARRRLNAGQIAARNAGVSYADIARASGVTPEAIRSKLIRAQQAAPAATTDVVAGPTD